MNKFKISRLLFSELFWNTVFMSGAAIIELAKKNILSKNIQIESLRRFAEYNTGSISISSSVIISLITSYFRPEIIAEIGTFIGRSTYSAALGHHLSGMSTPRIYTCDFSNNIRVNIDSILDGLTQYPKKSSSEMFTAIIEQNVFPDLYLLDGRLSTDDILLLTKLRAEDAVIILDDFEGTEKGVSNASILLHAFKEKFLLAYPPSINFLRSHGFTDFSTIGVMIPRSRVSFVNQG